MSTVRMCDKCGTVFSERAEDWSTYTGSIRRRDKATGRTETVSDTFDACPECTEVQMMGGQRPELPTTVSPRYEGGVASG